MADEFIGKNFENMNLIAQFDQLSGVLRQIAEVTGNFYMALKQYGVPDELANRLTVTQHTMIATRIFLPTS